MTGPRDEDVDPRYSAVFQRGYDPERDGVPAPAPDEGEPAESDRSDTSAAPEPEESAASEPEAGPDPEPDLRPVTIAVRAVVVVGAISLAFLIAAVVITLTPTESSSSVAFPALLRVALPPALMLGGGIGLALTAVLAAVRVPR